MSSRRWSCLVTGLLFAGTLLGGCTQTSSGAKLPSASNLHDAASDAMLTMSVKMALTFQPGVKAMDIDVDTDHGTVTLNGRVRTETERQLAEEVAEGVSGVKLVVNEIHLRG